jgi:hypothetical protein
MSDQGDVIHSITVGSSSMEFLLRGQLYLVAVSSRGEAPLALRRQLELLYQCILMVATGGGPMVGRVCVCVVVVCVCVCVGGYGHCGVLETWGFVLWIG